MKISSKSLFFTSLLIGSACLGGCYNISTSTDEGAYSPDHSPQPITRGPNAPVDSAEVQLAEAASSVSSSLTSLAQVQQAATPAKRPVQPPLPSSYGMGEMVSVNWNGPIGPLVDKIAELTHYHVRVLGTPPSIPILVMLDAQDVPIGTILQNAGYQANKRADIVVYPSTKIIELRYAKA